MWDMSSKQHFSLSNFRYFYVIHLLVILSDSKCLEKISEENAFQCSLKFLTQNWHNIWGLNPHFSNLLCWYKRKARMTEWESVFTPGMGILKPLFEHLKDKTSGRPRPEPIPAQACARPLRSLSVLVQLIWKCSHLSWVFYRLALFHFHLRFVCFGNSPNTNILAICKALTKFKIPNLNI